MSPEEIDLAEVAAELRDQFSSAAPSGYVRGRTAFRDALVAAHGWSQLEAEQVVDTMIARGFVRFEGDPATSSDPNAPWRFQTPA